MSMAWEVTVEDIGQVLEAHGSERDPDEVLEAFSEGDRVERAVLRYTKFDDQVASALDEIEDILIEDGVISGGKVFSPPGVSRKRVIFG